MNLKFYLTSTSILTSAIVGGFYVGYKIIFNKLFSVATDPYGEEALGFIPYLFAYCFLGSFVGLATGLIIIHKLGKKWGSKLNFGQHPVFKLTVFSFLTFLALLFFFVIGYGYFKLEIQGK